MAKNCDLPMTNDEIRHHHKYAINPDKHVTILAQLNGTDRATIQRILGVPITDEKRQKTIWTRSIAEEIALTYNSGCSIGETAAKHGVRRDQVLYVKKRYPDLFEEDTDEKSRSRRRQVHKH